MAEQIEGLNSLITASQQIAIAIGQLNKTLGVAFPSWTTGQIPGTNTNGDALAGNIGEYIASTVLSGAAVPLTVSATPYNVTSIALTAGDWDVWGTVGFTANAATTATIFEGGINTVTNTLPIPPGNGAYAQLGLSVAAGALEPVLPVGATRISLNAPTTVYLVAQSTFAINTMSAFGILAARRRR